mgnify:CR=1 FL=1|tara:strand:+ start:1116 stop:1358 length:243 start_codon:yes stop_codon:yes gene_type:complete
MDYLSVFYQKRIESLDKERWTNNIRIKSIRKSPTRPISKGFILENAGIRYQDIDIFRISLQFRKKLKDALIGSEIQGIDR